MGHGNLKVMIANNKPDQMELSVDQQVVVENMMTAKVFAGVKMNAYIEADPHQSSRDVKELAEKTFQYIRD